MRRLRGDRHRRPRVRSPSRQDRQRQHPRAEPRAGTGRGRDREVRGRLRELPPPAHGAARRTGTAPRMVRVGRPGVGPGTFRIKSLLLCQLS